MHTDNPLKMVLNKETFSLLCSVFADLIRILLSHKNALCSSPFVLPKCLRLFFTPYYVKYQCIHTNLNYVCPPSHSTGEKCYVQHYILYHSSLNTQLHKAEHEQILFMSNKKTSKLDTVLGFDCNWIVFLLNVNPSKVHVIKFNNNMEPSASICTQTCQYYKNTNIKWALSKSFGKTVHNVTGLQLSI